MHWRNEHSVGSTLTRNDPEEAFLAIARAIERPPDAVNLWIAFPDGGGAEADAITWQQVTFEPATVAHTLRGLLT